MKNQVNKLERRKKAKGGIRTGGGEGEKKKIKKN